jgi:cytochrome c553
MELTRLWRTLALLVIGGLNAAGASGADAARVSSDLRRQAAVQGDASTGAAKAAVCGGCHGPQGNAPIAEFPSLAGQSATYLYLQLREFKDGGRPNEIMRPQVEQLSDQDLKDLSAYYASLTAERSAAAVEGSSEGGRELFTRGNSRAGIPPCQGCHGVAGKGPAGIEKSVVRPATNWHTFPSLAGQQPQYIVTQLMAYKSRMRGGTTNARIMQGIAQELDDSAMQQVAAYLSQLAKN